MTQFNFTKNIEKRMPDTDKVFCIDRMTSDYAEQHPLDVDGFIESVYQEFAGTEFEESREVLKQIWIDVMSDTNHRGDASIYPNKNGEKRAAAMKVWHMAGDYWRRGFRHGDTLPDMVPMCKITRLNDGTWIALFPKDVHLLSDEQVADSLNDEITTEPEPTPVIEPAHHQAEPRQLDLFAFEQLQQENDALKAQIAQMQAQQSAERFAREQTAHRPQPKRRPAPVRRQQPQAVAATKHDSNYRQWLKVAGYLVAGLVAILVIWQTGLLIPLGLIGLATSGLLK